MHKISFGFATMEKAHAVQKAIRDAGFYTINTHDVHGFYVHAMTGEENREVVEAARQAGIDSLK